MANYNDYLEYLQHVDNTTKQEVTAKIDSLNEEIANLKSTLTNLKKIKDSLSDELVKAQRQINEQTDRINLNEVELQITAKKGTALENDLANSQKVAKQLETEKENLEKELLKKNEEIINLKEDISRLETTIKELRKGISRKHRKIILILSSIIVILVAILIIFVVNTNKKATPKTPIVVEQIKVEMPKEEEIKDGEVRYKRIIRPDSTIFRYTGTLQNGLPNGKGCADYADGRHYKGDFVDGYRHGEGKMTFPDSTVYEGNYVMDKAEGQGIITYPSGKRYKAEYKNDQIIGKLELIIREHNERSSSEN